LQRKFKTVQKLEGATQKSLDEEIKSTDNIPIESISQKSKAVDEDAGQTKSELFINPTSVKKDNSGKSHSTEEAKEKCSYATGANANNAQNGQNANIQEKDVVDSVEPAVITPQSREAENVTPNDKANGT